LDNGFYISFGKYLLRSQNLGTDLETVFKNMPNDKFFLETDTVEEGIEDVYALAAKYKGTTIEEIQKQINKNFATVFD
jgi:TatD DNase family protein